MIIKTCCRLLATLLLLLPLCGLAQVQVINIRSSVDGDNTRFVFDLSDDVVYRDFVLTNPHRVVIDLDDSEFNKEVPDAVLKNTPVSAIRHHRQPNKQLRIVLDLTQHAQVAVSIVQASVGAKPKLVVDLQTGEPKPVIAADSIHKESKKVMIAIDPGHGGKDPGAVGPKGKREKDVLLAIAKELKKTIDKEPGFEAVLTRTGDYYISLRGRLAVARKAKADMFVAIHADAYKTPTANGASVFALSARGATSEAARWLAEKENRSELMGGVDLADKDTLLRSVLIDLSQTHTISVSLSIGQMVLTELKKSVKLHRQEKPRVEQAAFVVLKSPDIPSILVETGFISNPQEERLLMSRSHQQKLATAIKNGVKDYFAAHGRLNQQRYAAKPTRTTSSNPKSYVVKKGDTLYAIAKRYKIDVKKLQSYNQLSSSILKIGQVIKLPS